METAQEEKKVEATPTADQSPATTEKADKGKKAGGQAEKEAKKAERLAKRQEQASKAKPAYVKDPNDPCADMFGDLPLNRSQSDPEKRYEKKFTQVHELEAAHNGQEVIVRGRLHNFKSKSKKLGFVIIRERFATVQAIVEVNLPAVSEGMVGYAASIPKESIIEVRAKVVVPDKEVQGTSQKVELVVSQIWCINKSAPMLPLQLEDAGRRVENQEDEEKFEAKPGEEVKEGKVTYVGQDVRLNNRVIDLRVPTNQALMRLQSGVCQLFREFLNTKGFTEIHSPKLIGGTSEGGANVFRLDYFGQEACLA